MDLAKLLGDKREEVLKIAGKHGARNIRLFGSVARGDAKESSDIDLLVKMEAGSTLLDIVAIGQDLEDLLGCKVHVVTEAAISPFIRENVLKEAVNL